MQVLKLRSPLSSSSSSSSPSHRFPSSFRQVKQQKKSSSNKWTCAVCNEKQSVRNVFARSSLARDVRTFVQSFNFARGNLEDGAILANSDSATQPSGSFQKQKRTNWCEYLDCEEGGGKEVSEAVGFESEIEVVTELPKQLRKPVFSKRKRKENNEPNKFPNKTITGSAAKCSDYPDEGNKMFKKERESHDSNKYKKVVATQPSKWSNYLEAEENEILERERGSCDSYNTWGRRDVLQSQFKDQSVEEDIHPDFM